MKKLILALMILAVLACPAMGQRYRQHQIAFLDEFGRAVTTITQITVFDAGEVTSPTIYADRAGTLTMVNPITAASSNSTFDAAAGFVRWFQRAPDYKVTVTDGTKVLTVDSRNELDTRFAWFDNYIGTAASLSVADNQEIVVGTDSDAVCSWVNGTSILRWLPDSDGVTYDIGSTLVDKQFNFNVHVGGVGGGGFSINEATPSLAWTGGTATLAGQPVSINNDAAANITNIGTGTTTGAINIGSNTSGIVTIDGTTSATFSVDEDLNLTSTEGSVVITATEAVADGVVINSSAGGLDLSAVDNIDMVLTAAAGSDDFKITVAGGQDASIHLLSDGTAADAISLITSAGGIDITVAGATGAEDLDISSDTAVNITSSQDQDLAINIATSNAAGQIVITTTDTTVDGLDINATGGIDIDTGDDYTVDVAGAAGQDYMITNAGGSMAWTTTEADVADAMTFTTTRSIIDIKGPVNMNATYCLFEDEPVYAKWGANGTPVWGGVATGTDGDENVMIFPSASFIYHIIGTETELGPQMRAGGFDISLDDADDEGIEITPNILGRGATGGSRQAFIIDTDVFYLKVKMYMTDVSGTDDLCVGFRKVEAFQAAVNTYTDYAVLRLNAGDIYIESDLNGAAAASDDTTDNWGDTTAVTLGILVDITGAVTYTIDGSAPSSTQAFTFDTTDVVVPFIYLLHEAADFAELTYLQSWECGLQY